MREPPQMRFQRRKMGIKKEKTPVNRDFLLATFLSKVTSKYGGPGGIRTLDLSDANRTLSRTRHNASTERLEGNGCVSFKTGARCVLSDFFHRTVRTPAPILSEQELSISSSLPALLFANHRNNISPIIG